MYRIKLRIEDFLKIIFNMDKEFNLAIYMSLEDISNKVKNKEGLWFSKINKNMSIVVSSKIINIMDMGLSLMMSESLKVSSSMVKKTVLISSHGLMAHFLKEGM